MLDIIINKFKHNKPDIIIYNKNVSYYLYLFNLKKVFTLITVKISLLDNLVFTFSSYVLNVENTIYILSTSIKHKKINYAPIINIKNYDNIFNLYYRYIVKMFSVKKWKSYCYGSIINFYYFSRCQCHKKFNTMKQYKCIVFI
jgi:hypothetical protein